MPRAPLPRCSTPGCRAKGDRRGRCALHERLSSRNHGGRARQARGLGAAHERARREVVGSPCGLRLEGCTGIATTLEHVLPRSQGGTLAHGYIGACAHCQCVQGAQLSRKSWRTDIAKTWWLGGSMSAAEPEDFTPPRPSRTAEAAR